MKYWKFIYTIDKKNYKKMKKIGLINKAKEGRRSIRQRYKYILEKNYSQCVIVQNMKISIKNRKKCN